AGNEHAGRNRDAKAAELRPAKDVLKRQARHPAVHHVGEIGWRRCGREEQLRFGLGVNAASRPEPGHDLSLVRLPHPGSELLVKCVSVSMSLILCTCRGGVSNVAYGRTRMTTRCSSSAI